MPVFKKDLTMKEDRLAFYRDSEKMEKESHERFLLWLDEMSAKAVSHEKLREMTSEVKQPIRVLLQECNDGYKVQ